MATPLVLVTGFGPFVNVAFNPSGALAMRLESEPPPGIDVRAFELPVTFGGLAAAYASARERLGEERPVALLSLGVHRGPGFRLERRARARLHSEKRDNDGVLAAELDPLGTHDLHTTLDLDALGFAMLLAGAAGADISEDAGGFVCERCYYEVLSVAGQLLVPGLFVHVPPEDVLPVEVQFAPLQALVTELVRQADTHH